MNKKVFMTLTAMSLLAGCASSPIMAVTDRGYNREQSPPVKTRGPWNDDGDFNDTRVPGDENDPLRGDRTDTRVPGEDGRPL